MEVLGGNDAGIVDYISLQGMLFDERISYMYAQ